MNKDQHDEITRLADLPDNKIDTSDIPEKANWTDVEIGRFYRPSKSKLHSALISICWIGLNHRAKSTKLVLTKLCVSIWTNTKSTDR
jgi:hypothetical protein